MTAGAAAAAADKAQGARQRTMATDLAARAMGIHWPTGFEPERADLFAHNETVVEASCETVSHGVREPQPPFQLGWMPFSAARYSFRASSSWSTVPVT